ncbi:hypothetical protein, partial [Paracoccus laeviglucosivorans]|uniref:hypothetical protein n=1 Tax=Paracoccus laeviglucosivorans TaxID=1197861 RepID=UPI00163D69A7
APHRIPRDPATVDTAAKNEKVGWPRLLLHRKSSREASQLRERRLHPPSRIRQHKFSFALHTAIKRTSMSDESDAIAAIARLAHMDE